MSDLLSFEDMLNIDDKELDELINEYKHYREERAQQQYKSFKVLPLYPQIVIDSIEYLRMNKSKYKEGIFRVNGDSKAVNRIRNGYEHGFDDVLSEVTNIEPYDVATALKSYFRFLDNPLIPDENYERMKDIVDGTTTPEEQLLLLREEIGKIKSPNIEVLSYIMKYFQEVIAEAETNKMSAKNMGTCLTMSITRFEYGTGTGSGGGNSLVAMVEIGLSTKILCMMLTDINFDDYLSPEVFEEMRAHSSYKPEKMIKLSTKQERKISHVQSKENKPSEINPTPKVPPRVPPRNNKRRVQQ